MEGIQVKRVYCLYRVSTKGQVDHDDIPMQRIECRKFAEEKGWTIVREEAELGVSGYKLSAEQRDKLQIIKADAEQGKFDVLLVFMFDRLGRRQDETPFVVEWFVKHGIEVWSTREGQQTFNDHVDYLLNYIRFWQASGESGKTSTRIKTRLKQMVEQGVYTGGAVQYGYCLVNNGRVNKKGNPVKDKAIDPAEMLIVQEIHRRALYEGVGTHTMAEELNARGLRTHNGSRFQANTIRRILLDPEYMGYLITADAMSPHIPELEIIDQETKRLTIQLVQERLRSNNEKRRLSWTNRGQSMLGGNLFCACCGKHLCSAIKKERYKRADGTVVVTPVPRYICYHATRHLNDCTGQQTYQAERVDKIVTEIAHMIFNAIRDTPREASITLRMQNKVVQLGAAKKDAINKMEKTKRELDALTDEISKCLLGESRFSEEVLGQMIDKKKGELKAAQALVQQIDTQASNQQQIASKIGEYYDQFTGWADEFDAAPMDRKRMIMSELFSRIELDRNYQIRFEIELNYKQFLDGVAPDIRLAV